MAETDYYGGVVGNGVSSANFSASPLFNSDGSYNMQAALDANVPGAPGNGVLAPMQGPDFNQAWSLLGPTPTQAASTQGSATSTFKQPGVAFGLDETHLVWIVAAAAILYLLMKGN